MAIPQSARDPIIQPAHAQLGSTTCGEQTLVCQGGYDAFVVKLSGATGDVLWRKTFGDGADQSASGVAVDPANNILITGEMFGTIEPWSPGLTLQDAGNGDAFVIKVGPDGSYKWGKRFGDETGSQAGLSITVGELAGPVVVGRFESTIDIGSKPSADDGSDVFVVALTSSGSVNWVQRLGDLTQAVDDQVFRLRAVANGAGHIYVSGRFVGKIGAGANAVDSGEMSDLFAGKLGADGEMLWAKRWNAKGDIRHGGIAVSPVGGLLVSGGFGESFELGPNWMPISAGGTDIFVASLAP